MQGKQNSARIRIVTNRKEEPNQVNSGFQQPDKVTGMNTKPIAKSATKSATKPAMKAAAKPVTKPITKPQAIKNEQAAAAAPADRKPADKAYDTGYAKGYEQGRKDVNETSSAYQEGFDRGFKDGRVKGVYEGGDGIVDSLMPEYEVLPDIPIDRLIAAGIDHYRPQAIRLVSAAELGERLLRSLAEREPMSVVRLGDGELLTLAQVSVMPIEAVREEGAFLPAAGVNVPDLQARDQLLESVKKATLVGIPKMRVKNFLPLAFEVFRVHQLDYKSLQLTDSFVNYYLHYEGYLPRLTAGRRVLLIGDKSPDLAAFLKGQGVEVAAAIAPVRGVRDVPRVMELVAEVDFDLAFVSAGIAAVIISERIATELGKVAIDFGHLADSLVKGETAFR